VTNADVDEPIRRSMRGIGLKVAWRDVDYQVTRDAIDHRREGEEGAS
jgi:hypothetical protein